MSIPLFDKLYAIGDQGVKPISNTLNIYLESIEKEVNRLLETRHAKKFDDSNPTNIINYGLPENIWTKVRTEFDRIKIQNRVVKLIEYFEPRLISPNVIVKKEKKSVLITISGSIIFLGQREAIEFYTRY
jgi:predicted component of type VI protein secretion system